MAKDRLDCLVIGYHDMPFDAHADRLANCDVDWPERRIFMRDHVMVEGERLPYMDVINRFVNRRQGADGYYHVAEVPNLGALYLANFLRVRGLSAEFVSLFAAERNTVCNILESDRPRVVAITTTFYLVPWPVEQIVKCIRRYSPDTLVVVGGPLVNNLVDDLDPEALSDILSWTGADVYVRESQGEATLERLVRAARSGSDPSEVSNCYVRSEDQFRFTGAAPENNPLDECVIDWSSFDADQLGETVQTRTARSCAYHCSFCDFPIRAGSLSLTSVTAVERELRQLAARGVKNLIFVDDTFNVPVARFKDLCRMFIDNNFEFSWYSYFRCSAVRDTETFDLMAASGCRGVFLGVESGDERILSGMSKSTTLERYERGIEALRDHGITTFASFISGFPGETSESINNTIDFINRTAPDYYRMEPWWYNHRSPIHRKAAEFQLTGQGYSWEHATMNIQGACQAIDQSFEQVTNSLWMPLYNYDFWSVPYLFGKGFTSDNLKAMHHAAGQLMQFNDTPERDTRALGPRRRAVESLQQLFDQVKLAPPRYQTPARADLADLASL